MILEFDDKKKIEGLKLYVNYVTKFVKQYEWLINSFLVNFYIEDSWKNLPNSWINYLNFLEPLHLSQFLNNEKITLNIVQPLSLICFRKCGQIFSFSRKESNRSDLDKFLKKFSKNNNYQVCNLDTMNLKYIFTRHLKLKKRHEVSRMGSFIDNLVCSKSIKLIDFGSGQGHLDRLLAFNFNFNVITIEAENNHSQKALKHDEQALKYLSSKFYNKNLEEIKQPQHLSFRVDDINSVQFDFDLDQLGLIGLHCCGTLSVTMLEIFAKNFGKYLFLCSCCYHKCEKSKIPLSNFVKKKNINFTFEMTEIACHSIENYIEKLKENINSLRIHCYRALLEYIFFKKLKKFKLTELSKVRKFETMSFEEYCHCATKNLDISITKEDLKEEDIQTKLDSYLKIIKFYILRLHLAPMLENLIQVDKILFLNETNNKINSYLVPLFDPKLSPRNFLLFSTKS